MTRAATLLLLLVATALLMAVHVHGMFKGVYMGVEHVEPGDYYGWAFHNVKEGEYPFQVTVVGNQTCNAVFEWDGLSLSHLSYDHPDSKDCEHAAYMAVAADFTRTGLDDVLITSIKDDEPVHVMHFARKLVVDAVDMRGVKNGVAFNRDAAAQYQFLASTDKGLKVFEVEQETKTGFHVASKDVSEGSVFAGEPAATGMLVGPFTSQRSDVLVGFRHYKNMRNGRYKLIDSKFPASERPASANALFAHVDLRDGNRNMAIIEADPEHGQRLWVLEDDTEEYVNVASGAFAGKMNVQSVCVADFDNDGFQEVFMHNSGEPNRLFTVKDNNLVEIDAGDAAEPERLGTGCAVGDFDGDGYQELVLSHRNETALLPPKYMRKSVYERTSGKAAYDAMMKQREAEQKRKAKKKRDEDSGVTAADDEDEEAKKKKKDEEWIDSDKAQEEKRKKKSKKNADKKADGNDDDGKSSEEESEAPKIRSNDDDDDDDDDDADDDDDPLEEISYHPLTLYRLTKRPKHRRIAFLPLTLMGAPARHVWVQLKDTEGGVQTRVIDTHHSHLGGEEPIASFGLGPKAALEKINLIYPTGMTKEIALALDLNKVHQISYPPDAIIRDEL